MEAAGTFDFIVAGGGTAALLTAGRLAENPKVRVLVVEAGKDEPDQIPEIITPGLAFHLPESEHDWGYETTMVDKPSYKRVEANNTRGKVLGGSSCLNYFTWLRGSAETYNDWADYGGPGWSWASCFDYFKKESPATFFDDEEILTDEPPNVAANELNSLLEVSPAKPVPLADPLTRAWTSRGHPMSGDVFDGKVDGLTHVIRSIHRGQRSTSACFVKGKKNVTVLTSSHVEQVILHGDTAVGVLVSSQDGGSNQRIYYAEREVIISCGVFETPKLLMLSGIGPEEQLLEHRIPIVVASPHVGKNLQDHPILPHVFRVPEEYSVDTVMRPGREHDEAVKLYRETRTGPLTSGLLEMTAFARIDPRLETCRQWRELVTAGSRKDPLGPGGQPHLEVDFVPCFASPFQPHIKAPTKGGYLTVIVSLLRPASRGTVALRSSNAADQPEINLNFLSEDVDVIGLREGVCFVDDILLKGDGIRDLILGEYPEPLPRTSDSDMDKLIHERVSTGYHPCGTCRMGKNISHGVVDSRLRVYGAKRLRVIDASVIPIIPDARIQSPVYMIAEKGAEMILQDHSDLWKTQPSTAATLPEETRLGSGVSGFISAVRRVWSGNRELWQKAMG